MRTLLNTIDAVEAKDGDGVKMYRLSGPHLNSVLDPFLMVDEFKSDDAADYIGGFPEHPHRGFETITYMKAGRMRHRDHMGNEGVIEAGGVQWMTAGKGVLHSEMPEQESGLLHGFQIWLNLPASEKMKSPAYNDMPSATIPEFDLPDGGRVRVIAGELNVEGHPLTGALAVTSPTAPSTEPLLIDLQLGPNKLIDLAFKAENTALVYLYHGEVKGLKHRQMAVYSKGDRLQLRAGPAGANALVFSGRPLKEPIVQYGPFVMNSREEIDQALLDFRRKQLV